MRIGTNSSDRSHRKIKIKRRVIEGINFKNNNDNNDDRVPTTTKLYKVKATLEGGKLLPSEDEN